MAATDIPIALRGISDPRQWTAEDWLSDLVPHLVCGATVTTVLRQQEKVAGRRADPAAERSSTVRSAVIGVASGLRSSTGIAAALLSSRQGPAHRTRLLGATALVGGELVADKHPNVPSRLAPPALAGRVAAGGAGAAALAHRDRADTASALILGNHRRSRRLLRRRAVAAVCQPADAGLASRARRRRRRAHDGRGRTPTSHPVLAGRRVELTPNHRRCTIRPAGPPRPVHHPMHRSDPYVAAIVLVARGTGTATDALRLAHTDHRTP
ncbi:hypothetical protein ACFWAY_18175 [Rhodococcus sp. NPDC059968]|uniref:hypothetical protein n=1 Tax=Rhodococcus sp. NPDC059968 TaxID=3347017 RepID=UPI00366A8285